MSLLDSHLERVRAGVLQRFTPAMVAEWLLKNTTYDMRPFSYVDHEYQMAILSDTSQEVAVKKCSQVGISEVSVRQALALVNILDAYSLIYTLPTAGFAGKFVKTRIDPVILGSKVMSEAIAGANDNTEIKQFGNSFLYIGGAASSNAPISIPADHLIHDEFDFSDTNTISQYASRLTHSKWQRVSRFSTPTIPDYGIDRVSKESRRHFLFCRCDHCNEQFIPDYYRDVKIPDFKDGLETITKPMLARIRWEEAYLACPRCGMRPSLQWDRREWVCENPGERLVGAAYQVTPFDAPNIIKTSNLVKSSTSYERRQDFDNFGLGLAAADSEATLSPEDFKDKFITVDPGDGVNVMGVDCGAQYYFTIGRVTHDGGVLVIHREQCHMGVARDKFKLLKMKYRVICTVMDSMPHSETVMALQEVDVNLYAAVYMRSASVLTHNTVKREEKTDEGLDFVRQVNINRNKALDSYMEFIRQGGLLVTRQDEEIDQEYINHHCSMKRVKVYRQDELEYSWQKTDGIDHYHHSGLYMWIASKIKGVARPEVPINVFQIRTFQVKAQ